MGHPKDSEYDESDALLTEVACGRPQVDVWKNVAELCNTLKRLSTSHISLHRNKREGMPTLGLVSPIPLSFFLMLSPSLSCLSVNLSLSLPLSLSYTHTYKHTHTHTQPHTHTHTRCCNILCICFRSRLVYLLHSNISNLFTVCVLSYKIYCVYTLQMGPY